MTDKMKIENADGSMELSDSLRMMSRFMTDPRLSADVLLAANTLDSLVKKQAELERKLEIYEGTTGEHVSCSGVVEDMAGTIEFIKEKKALLEKGQKDLKNDDTISRAEADDLVKIREAQILSAIKGFRVHFTWPPSATFDDVQKMTAESYIRAVEHELNRDKTMGPFESLDEIKAREFQRAFARAIEVVRTWGSEEYEKHHIVDGSHGHVIYTLARLDAVESLQQMKKDKT